MGKSLEVDREYKRLLRMADPKRMYDIDMKHARSAKGKLVQKRSDFKRRYGLTIEDVEWLKTKQNNKCSICGTHFTQRVPFIDHNHVTNKARGLLCQQCNAGLGFFKDNPIFLKAAIVYLKQPPWKT